ncbi:hypothetical protein GOP47_0001869 [Adiantum capillus-veneris]|uniref:IC97/Casc1 N-terminal domain-containing protein n=1 Tax=Adiantum capillus-veneris TaxID=13818 RepID=A0A9D4V928_ADICA|nr:hypothetical protein GOP47_0001869 [Adiantum capillus-veneris]
MPPKQPANKKLSKQELKAQKKEQKGWFRSFLSKGSICMFKARNWEPFPGLLIPCAPMFTWLVFGKEILHRLEKKKEDAKKLAEERKRLAEEEAKRLEEEARLASEAEQARLKAEFECILQEKGDLSSFFEWRSSTLAKLEATISSQEDWTRFVEAGGIPHPTNEGNMNNYFDCLETSWDESYTAALSTVKSIYQVFLTTEEILLLEMEKGNTCDFLARFEIYMKKLELLMQKQMDRTTAYLLNKSYEVFKQTNESTVWAMAGEWKIYLWINHMKNPRLRALHEPTLGVTITIPKAFTFANVAIRAYHQMLNPFLKSANIYLSVGGIFGLDILSIPPASRSAKGWTLEHVTMMTSSVVHLGYPFAGDSSGAPSSIGLELTLPTNLIVTETIPEIGWWNDEEECWKKDGITDVEYDKLTRTLKFQTLKARPHSIIQSRVKYYPYHSWILIPSSEIKALFVLESHGSMIKIEVGNRCCKLLDTPFCECKHIIGQDLDPIILLKRLSRCGLHLMPVDTDGKLVYSCLKENNVERYACEDIGLAIPACAIASSKWNVEAGQDSCVVRVLEIPDPCFPPTFEKSKEIRMVLYKAKGNAILNMSERKSKDYKEDLLGEFHASIMVTLRDSVARESLEKMEKADPGFTNCFKRLALGLRLFSFTAVEPLPLPPPIQEQVQGVDQPTSSPEQQQTQNPSTESVSQDNDSAVAALAPQNSPLEAPQSSNPA